MATMYPDSSPPSEAGSLKRDTPDTASDDSRPRKRSRSASNATGQRTQPGLPDVPCYHTALNNQCPTRLNDDALDKCIINDHAYEFVLSLGEEGLAEILSLVAELDQGFDPRCSRIKEARELVKSDIHLKRLLSECVKAGHYAPVRNYAPLRPQPTVEDLLASEKRKWMPCLTHLARSDCLGRDTHGKFDPYLESLLKPESIAEEVSELDGYSNKVLVRGEQKFLFDGPGTRKTKILAGGMCKHVGFYFVPHKRHQNSPGSGSLMCALQRIFAEYNRHDGDRDYSTAELLRVIERLLILAVLAHVMVFDWFLECSDGVPISDILRRWTCLQLCPSIAATGEDGDIFVSILNQLIGWTDDQAISDAFWTLNKRRKGHLGYSAAFVILDDAHLAEDVAAAANFIPSVLDEHGESSMLSLIASAWQDPSRFIDTNMIMSGTKIPMYLDMNFYSNAAGKPGARRWWTSCATGGFDSEQSQRAYIMQKVWPDASPSALSIRERAILKRAWRWLSGRYCSTAVYVSLLNKFGTDSAHRLLNRLVEHLARGYVPTDCSALSEAEPGLVQDQEELLVKVLCIDISQITQQPGLESISYHALMDFALRGQVRPIPGDYHQAVASGLVRTMDHSMLSAAQLTPTSDHWDFRSLKLMINEPVAFAATIAFLESKGLNGLQDATFRPDTDVQTRISLCRGSTILALMRAFDGKKSLNQLFTFDRARKGAYFGQPARLVSIVGRDEDGNVVTEDLTEGTLPILVSEAENAEEVRCWRDGSGSPFLCPRKRLGADLACLVRAGDQYIWFSVDIDGLRDSSSKKSWSSLSEQELAESTADIYPILVPPSRGRNVIQKVQRLPIVQLRVSARNSSDAITLPARSKGSKTRPYIRATLDALAAVSFSKDTVHSLKRLLEKRIVKEVFN